MHDNKIKWNCSVKQQQQNDKNNKKQQYEKPQQIPYNYDDDERKVLVGKNIKLSLQQPQLGEEHREVEKLSLLLLDSSKTSKYCTTINGNNKKIERSRRQITCSETKKRKQNKTNTTTTIIKEVSVNDETTTRTTRNIDNICSNAKDVKKGVIENFYNNRRGDASTTCNYYHYNNINNRNNNNYNNDDNNNNNYFNKINQAFNFLHVRNALMEPLVSLSSYSRSSVWSAASTSASTFKRITKLTSLSILPRTSSFSMLLFLLLLLLLLWSRVLFSMLLLFSTTINLQMNAGTTLIMMTSATSRALIPSITTTTTTSTSSMATFILTTHLLLPTSVWAATLPNDDFKLQKPQLQQKSSLSKSSLLQLQLQQQQLFALLTQKQRQEQQPDIVKSSSNKNKNKNKNNNKNTNVGVAVSSGELLRKSRGGLFSHNLVDIAVDEDDDDDDDDDDNSNGNYNDDEDDDANDDDANALGLKLIEEYVAEKSSKGSHQISSDNSFLETTGFVADDGQQYEKVQKELLANLNNNNNNGSNPNYQNSNNGNKCPKSCQCLNDYFDCGKLQLKEVPELPEYVAHLNLVGNRLNATAALSIKNLPELHKLSLKRNQLDLIPKFVGLTALKHLNLANNNIKRIDSEALAVLPKLKSLDLTENYLHNIEASFFPTTNRLAHLILKSNEISMIEEHAFDYLGDLLELELDNNHLTSLPGGVFKSLEKLRKLSLNSNQLEINWSTFRGLYALQKLHLKSNRIRALQDGVFHVMRVIETIELDHNGITSLSRQGLFNLTKLHHLSLSNNSISRIEPDTWEFTQSLITLDLSHNNISDFRPQHLDCLQRLRHLNLGHNRLHYIMDTTFECVKNLEDLNLRRNQLSWVIEDPGAVPPFRVLRKLKKLDLFGNNLKQITAKSLSGLNSLETLNLGGNALANIQSGAFDNLPHLQKLMFKSLNFICDCDLLWFKRWLQRHAQGPNAGLKANAICGYPESLFDRELLEFSPQQLICGESPKPVITQEPSNQLTVKGANITMECIANSPASSTLASITDELKIKWRHDNQNIRDRQSPSSTYGSFSSSGSSSVLNNALSYGVSPASVIKEDSSILAFATAHAIAAAATANSGTNNNKEVPMQSYSYTTTETQIHIDPSTNQTTIIGYLKLYNVSYESAGRYQCVVSNSFGTTYSQKFKISIGIHPTFSQIPSNMTIDSGDTARLVCSATGDPMPQIALQKFGASDFPAATERRLQVIKEENAFVITNAKPIDTGIYTCTADSAAGEIKINASLIVNDKPLPHIPVVHKEVVLGQSSVLKCINELTLELASPHREWYKDNKPFHTSSTSDSERYYFTAEKEFLVIDDTQSMDAGHYHCEIHDQAKNYIMKMELLVVKAGFSENVIIIAVALLTVLCIVMGTLVVWCLASFQKRKLNMTANGSRVGQLSGMGGSRRASVNLDQTQLTTLNRTYLRQQTPQSLLLQQQQQQQQQHHLHQTQEHQSHKQQLRPRSLADLEYGLNGGRGLLNSTPAEELSRLLVTSNASNQVQSRATDNVPLTLDYLEHNNQDHLSSKDSGTGSDAAVKRSIDDFTLAALVSNGHGDITPTPTPTPTANSSLMVCTPTNTNKGVPPPKGPRAALAKIDTYTDDDDMDESRLANGRCEKDEDGDDEDEESDFTPTRTMGVSMYEIDSPYNAKINERTRFLPDTNNESSQSNHLKSSSEGGASGLVNNCKNNLATNLGQTVDI